MFKSNNTIPTKGSDFSAGWDFYAHEEIIILPKEHIMIDTGVKVTLPMGWFGLIKERSSLAKRGLLVLGGVIDCDYINDTIKVILYNCGEDSIVIKGGERFVQLIPIPTLVTMPEKYDRGGGLGSSGK